MLRERREIDPDNSRLWLNVNGTPRQDGNTSEMFFNISAQLSFITRRIHLNEGDLLLTGTPHGIGPVHKGDVIECGLGDLIRMRFEVE